MLRKSSALIAVSAIFTIFLAGCGSNSTKIGGCGGACPAQPEGTVYMTMTDDSPAGVSVLFFQVTLSSATLAPTTGSPVSLLNNIAAFGSDEPPRIDVTQLQALSTFLSTAQVAPGTYSSLSVTFTNPQLVIYNQSDSSLGGTCAVGSICQLTPAFDNNSSSLTFTSSPFPVTVSTTSPLGFLIDFHLNTVIQSDLSVNLGVANGVTISPLPAAPAPAQLGSITGAVATVTASTGVFTLQAPWGGSFDIATTGSTAFNNFPSSACTTPGIGCLAQGQIVSVGISSMAATGYSGVLTASQVTYVQAANTQTVEGTIIRLIPSNTDIAGAPPTLVLLLHANPANATGFPLGGIADVILSFNTTTYSIDSSGFTMPAGLTFTGPLDLAVGQNVTLTVTPGTLIPGSSGPGSGALGPPPSVQFGATGVELEPSQISGLITAADSSTTSFTLGVAGPFFAAWPMPSAVSSFDVVTTSQTSFTGFNPDNFGGLATNDFVSVNGWLFAPSTGSSPTIAAQSVLMRPAPAL